MKFIKGKRKRISGKRYFEMIFGKKLKNQTHTMKITENFSIEEFVPPLIYQKFGEYSIWFINKQLVLFSQFMRDTFGPIIINDWADGGRFDSRGYRVPDDPDGAKFSQHRLGNAVDLFFKTATPKQVRDYIITNFPHLNRTYGITTIEANTPTWVHVDCRWTNMNKILIVPYK